MGISIGTIRTNTSNLSDEQRRQLEQVADKVEDSKATKPEPKPSK